MPATGALLVVVPGHEALELAQEGERAQALHAVEVDPAVEVVALVLDHAREESLRLHRVRLAATVQDTGQPLIQGLQHWPLHVHALVAPEE